MRAGVEAKQCASPDGLETFGLVRSVERREKERAMHVRFGRRIEEGLAAIGRRLARARRPLARGRLERQVGRLLERNPRAGGRYVIEFVPDPAVPAGLRLHWTARPEWDDWTRWSEGCYVLRSNIADWNPEDLWRTYMQLTEVEAAFRIQKSELALRPVWHQRADRVQAHILVCVLAYVLWKTLEQWQRRAGLGQSPRTILEELRRIQSTDGGHRVRRAARARREHDHARGEAAQCRAEDEVVERAWHQRSALSPSVLIRSFAFHPSRSYFAMHVLANCFQRSYCPEASAPNSA